MFNLITSTMCCSSYNFINYLSLFVNLVKCFLFCNLALMKCFINSSFYLTMAFVGSREQMSL